MVAVLIVGASTLPVTGAVGVGEEEWVAEFAADFGDSGYAAQAVGISPDGARVFVAGSGPGGQGPGEGSKDWWTVAYDAATGSEEWSARLGGTSADDVPTSLAVAPDGARVFVAGQAQVSDRVVARTAAFDADSGELLWKVDHDPHARSTDAAQGLAVSPDGATVFVAAQVIRDGCTQGGACYDYVTIAYDAADGDRRWASVYDGAGREDRPRDLALSPDGASLFVTGMSVDGMHDYATVAYAASTGAQRWAARYNGPGNGYDGGESLAVSPDGARVFVGGTSRGDAATGDSFDYATVAYDAATGAQAWVARYDAGYDGEDNGGQLAVDPDGARVYVTGMSWDGSPDTDPWCPGACDVATVAYDAATGAQAWVARYDGPAGGHDGQNEGGRTIAVRPDGARVFVAARSEGEGTEEDYALLAYDSATGEQRWVARYDGPAQGGSPDDDVPRALALDATGARLVVTGRSGSSTESGNGGVFATVAYVAAARPSAPIGLVAEAKVGEILLTWQPPAEDGDAAIAYRVYRGEASGELSLLAQVDVPAYTDSGLPEGARRYYQVSAVNAVGEGPRSPEVVGRVLARPSAPRDPVASTGPGVGQITLAWQAPEDDGGAPVTNHRVYRGDASGQLSFLADAGTALQFTDAGLPEGVVRYYQVSAVNLVGEGAASIEVHARAPARPTAPQNLQAAPGQGLGEVALSWEPPAEDGGLAVTHYRIYRGVGAGAPSLLAEVGDVRSFVDSSASLIDVHTYLVGAVNPVGEGARSNAACSPAFPWVAPLAPPLGTGCALPEGWEERVLLEREIALGSPGVGANVLRLDAEPSSSDPRQYEVRISAAGQAVPALTLFTAGLVGPLHVELLHLPAQDVVVTVRLVQRYDPDQHTCLAALERACVVGLPLEADPADPTRWTSAGFRSELVLEVEVALAEVVVEALTVRLPLAGAAVPLLPNTSAR